MEAVLITAVDALALFSVIAFGLVIGSFINVVIYRVPKRESIVLPASQCPSCGHSLSAKDNLPIISYLLLRGECRYCGAHISIRYPIVEALVGAIVLIAYLTYGLTPIFFITAFFLLVLFTVSAIDIEHKIIPNVIIIPAIVFSGASLLALDLAGIVSLNPVRSIGSLGLLIGFIVGGGLLLLMALVWPSGMGGGDIKLAAFMGLFLGPYVVIALFFGFVFGSIGGIAAMALMKKGRRDQIPFGPYLAAGSAVTLFAGAPLAQWYLGFLQ